MVSLISTNDAHQDVNISCETTGELFVKSWYHLLGLSFSPRFGTEANGNPSSVSWSGWLDMVHVVHIREGI